MFMDEAGFGRISEPSYCWAPKGMRPIVPCHRIREYIYAIGAVDPLNGDKSFIVAGGCNTEWMNLFLQNLAKQYPGDYILLCGDNAPWHKSRNLAVPANIEFAFIPPRTPEMNPIEQIWREIRKDGFKNTAFKTLDAVEDKLCDAINNLSNRKVKSVCARSWFVNV